jgi:hypothetical protein
MKGVAQEAAVYAELLARHGDANEEMEDPSASGVHNGAWEGL